MAAMTALLTQFSDAISSIWEFCRCCSTEKDNNMVSVVESIAVGTPVLTTSVPYNSYYIRRENLGIVQDDWNEDTLEQICDTPQAEEAAHASAGRKKQQPLQGTKVLPVSAVPPPVLRLYL